MGLWPQKCIYSFFNNLFDVNLLIKAEADILYNCVEGTHIYFDS